MKRNELSDRIYYYCCKLAPAEASPPIQNCSNPNDLLAAKSWRGIVYEVSAVFFGGHEQQPAMAHVAYTTQDIMYLGFPKVTYVSILLCIPCTTSHEASLLCQVWGPGLAWCFSAFCQFGQWESARMEYSQES